MTRDALAAIGDLDAAFAVQRTQTGFYDKIGGWKLGATADAPMAAIGLDEPFLGPIPAQEIFDSGATVALFDDHAYFAECEITLEIGTALPPRDGGYSDAELNAAIAGWRASIEIVGLRVEGGPAGLGPKILADGAGHRATILGGEVSPDAWNGLAASLSAGDAAPEGGPANLMWGSMAEALRYLVDRQHRLSRPIAAGDILMTGTMTGMTPVKAGDTVEISIAGTKVTAKTTRA